MKIHINREACISCGICVRKCPQGYALDDEGKAVVINQKAPLLKEGRDACPVGAITGGMDAADVAQNKETPEITCKRGASGPLKDVWVFAEQREGHLEKVAFQLLGKARELADELGHKVIAVLAGDNVEHLAKELIGYHADKVYVANHKKFEHYQTLPYARIFANLIKEHRPSIFLFGATFIGRDLAPRIAQRVHTGLTADCTDLGIDSDTGLLNQTRPAFGGNIMATIQTPNHGTQMATVRPGVMKVKPFDAKRSGEIVKIAVKLEENDLVCKILEVVKDIRHNVNLEEAGIIVSGGRGVGSKEGFEVIKKLARTLNAEVGGSRVAVEKGWVDQKHQVGQTGKIVSPQLYIACGISGSIQHKVGMSGAKTILAINRDKNAPIIAMSDYAIIGDLHEIIPLFIKEIKERREKQADEDTRISGERNSGELRHSRA